MTMLFHSSSQIAVGHAIGKIDFKFGIFWNVLKFTLKQNNLIIDAYKRVDNMIVTHRPSTRTINALDRKVFDEVLS